MQNQNRSANAQHQTLVIIWSAILMSQFMLLAIAFITKPELFRFDFSRPLLGGENSIIIIVLAVLGISTFLMSFALKKNFLSQAVQQQKPALVQSAVIVACALCEATSLFGFITAFIANYQYFFVWFALGILGLILHFPKRDDVFAASYKK